MTEAGSVGFIQPANLMMEWINIEEYLPTEISEDSYAIVKVWIRATEGPPAEMESYGIYGGSPKEWIFVNGTPFSSLNWTVTHWSSIIRLGKPG